MAHALHESIRCLANGTRAFTEKCLVGLEADAERCKELTTRSLMLVTALTPHIGYDRAAEIAKRAHHDGSTLKQAALALGYVTKDEFDLWVQVAEMTHPNLA